MTKSCVAKQTHYFVNLHEFLKTKRGVVKFAKKTVPDNNWSDSVKKQSNDGRSFGNLIIQEFHGSFWIGDRILRRTSSGLVFLAKNKSPTSPNPDLPTRIVVKSCFIEFSSSLHREKEVACSLAPCENVVRCYGDEITTTESGEGLYNVLFEHCSGSSLRDHIVDFGSNGLPESRVRRYMRDIVRGLYHMHCNAGYVHGNIKPRNVLLLSEGSSFTAKIASFGLVKKLTREVLCDHEISGSGPYVSPELARDGYLDWLADIWALGCVVLEMLTGKAAWNFESANDYMLNCYNDDLPKIPNEISSAGKDFVKKCLVRSAYKRRPIWLLIKHPFICQ